MPDTFHMGGCGCGRVRYRLHDTALIVHACHCRMCQRLTGSSNAVNALIEADKVEHLTGDTIDVEAFTPSGHGQVITRCPACYVAVWSEYRAMTALCGASLRFIRAGTLDSPDTFPPDVHIYAATMLPYFTRHEGMSVYDSFYDLKRVWPRASLDRLSRAQTAHRRAVSGVGSVRSGAAT